MFLKPKIAVKESNVEVWDYKLFNGRQLLSPSELLFSIRKITPLWCSDQELLSYSLLAAVRISSCLVREVVRISVVVIE